MKSILMIVGNGLSLDLRKFVAPQLEKWNPTYPLQWDLYTPGNLAVSWLQSLPKLNKIISSLRQKEPKISDFAIFNKSLQFAKCNSGPRFDKALLEAEMQHFLAIAFSYFQLEVDKINFDSWVWNEWFNTYGRHIQGAVSFNYDLVLESAMKQSGLSVRRFGVVSESQGVYVLKPHGSIDFDINGIVVPVEYPIQIACIRNNSPLKHLKRSELLEPRTEADIVLPYEYSTQLDYQWIKPGYDWIQQNGAIFTHCIIVGLSYGKCDRREIDFILNSLSTKTRIIVVNPKPSRDLMNKLKEKFDKITKWKNEPKDLY